MNFKFPILFVSSLGILLSGCATPANVEQMIHTAEESKKASPISTYYKSVIVTNVSGGSETNPLFSSQVSTEDFKSALHGSLRNANYLADKTGRYALTADLISLEQPFMGINMTVRAAVDYKLKDQTSGRILFDETIETPFTATMSDAFVGVERLRLANEGAIKRNILKLIDKLSSFARTT